MSKHSETSAAVGETRPRPRAWRRWALPCLLAATLLGSGFCDPRSSWGQRSPQRVTPTPTLNPIKAKQKEQMEIYEGYARLFVLGHVLSRAFGVRGVLPESIDLDFFNQSQMLADAGDVYIYRPVPRVDVMWPLLIPTPPPEPVFQATLTPTPEPEEAVIEEPVEPEMPTPTPTPTATPTPTEVAPPPIALQGVSVTPTKSFVVIANQILTVGDTFGEARILNIEKHYAEIEYFGARFYVTKTGAMKPEEFSVEELELGY